MTQDIGTGDFDHASYSARLRSKSLPYEASLYERACGVKRGHGPKGETLTVACGWKIADDRKCYEGFRDDWDALFGLSSGHYWYDDAKAEKDHKEYRKNMREPDVQSRIERNIFK